MKRNRVQQKNVTQQQIKKKLTLKKRHKMKSY